MERTKQRIYKATRLWVDTLPVFGSIVRGMWRAYTFEHSEGSSHAQGDKLQGKYKVLRDPDGWPIQESDWIRFIDYLKSFRFVVKP